MNFISYFKLHLKRRKARRITQEYPAVISTFNLKNEGKMDFANWDNPLVTPFFISQEMVDFFRKFIKEGDLVIDIGANIGDTTMLMGLAAGSLGTTLGFEPNPLVYKILQVNANLNKGRHNIIPLPYAISNKAEEYFYYSSEASFANGGISKSKIKKNSKFVYPEKVKGIVLEDLLNRDYRDKVEKLSFIKVDTEGFDKEIIKSISSIIDRYKPVIVAECIKYNTPEEKEELYNVISSHGYEIFYFSDFVTNAEIIKLNQCSDIHKWKETINIYAVPSGKN